MKDALLAPVLLLGLIGLCYAIGRVILGKLGGSLTVLERFVFAVPLGMGVTGYFVLAVGLIGFLNPFLFGGLLVAGIFGLYQLTRDILAARPLSLPRTPLALICYVVFALLGICTFIAALAPPAGLDYDSLSYHLAAPKVYLQKGHIEYLPWDHHSNFPFTLEMLYTLMLSLGSIGAAKLCHWLCGALLVVSAYAFARRAIGNTEVTRGQTIGFIAALTVATTPILLWESTTAYIDNGTALFTWLALYGYLVVGVGEVVGGRWSVIREEGIGGAPTSDASSVMFPPSRTTDHGPQTTSPTPTTDHRPPTTFLLPSALLMGFALGTKYTVLGFWGLMLVGIFVAELVAAKRLNGTVIGRVALWGGVALLVGLPWYVKNVINTGNPVYPFAYEIFGGKYWSLENAKQYAAAQALFGMGKTPLDLLLSPWYVTMEWGLALPQPQFFLFTEYIKLGFGLSPIPVALLLLTPFVATRLSVAGRICLVFGLAIFAFWFFIMQQTRYLVPALPALAYVAAETLWLLREEGKRLAYGMASLLIAGTALWSLSLANGLMSTALPVVSGQISLEDYVRRRLGPMGVASFWINENTPKDAKVALFEVQGFYLDREYLWAQPDHAAGLLPWDEYKDVDEWLADFKKRGLTTLLLGIPLEGTDGKRWRVLMKEAIDQGKITLVRDISAQPANVQVYRIP